MNPLQIQRLREEVVHARYLVNASTDTRFGAQVRMGFARDAVEHLTSLLDKLYVEQCAAFEEGASNDHR